MNRFTFLLESSSNARRRSALRHVRVAACCLACCVLVATPLAGQAFSDCLSVADQMRRALPDQSCTSRELLEIPARALGGVERDVPNQVGEGVIDPARAFLYSALVPGATQWKMGQRRWIAYLVLEGMSWFAFGRARSSAFDRRGQYETLAWDVARTFEGGRLDGDFAYYEALEKFEESGVFDIDSSMAGVQPQTDPATFNGSTWTLAQQIFFGPGSNPMPGDPNYDAALAFYQAEGYDEPFEWAWTGRPADWERYRNLIEASDEDFRRASQFIGVVIANHLLSGVDGFISARLRSAAGDRSSARLRVARDDSTNGIGLVLQVLR